MSSTPAIRDAELFAVGTDHVEVTFVTEPGVGVATRVGDCEVTTTGPYHVVRVGALAPDTPYALEVEGAAQSALLPAELRTLPRPSGNFLATVATVNDVHFGETECGRLGDSLEIGPTFSALPGELPYPEVMNRAAIAEIAALDPDAVIAKGDLTNSGTDEEYDAYLAAYGALDPRMHHVRGNHDAMTSPTLALNHAPFAVELEGVTLAVVDTVVPGIDRGGMSDEQLAWLDELAAQTSRPLLVFGHHHPWDPEASTRSATYFGINPDDSESLADVIGRRDAIAGYFAGHTHRNRVRRFERARRVPMVEVACVKDYPGAWAEYRVYDGGYTQVVHRIGAPAAMAWSEKTRAMFHGLYRDYALGTRDDRCFTQRF